MKAEELQRRAKAAGIVISTAESCTGGLVAAAITNIAGSSAIFERGFVTYSNDAKQEMLGVSPETLIAHGAVSEEVAGEMATGALGRSKADIAISVTGIAGPGGSDHKPEGRVCFGLASRHAATITETQDFGPQGRAAIRQASVDRALDLLLSALPV